MADTDVTDTLVRWVRDMEEVSCTVLAPTQSIRLSRESGKLAVKRATGEFDVDWAGIERIKSPIEEALPEMAFQSQQYDLAIINMAESVDDVIVAFYFLRKMVSAGGLICFINGHQMSYRPLHTLLGANRSFRDVPMAPQAPARQTIWQNGYRQLPGWLKRTAESVIHPDLLAHAKPAPSKGSLWVLKHQGGSVGQESEDFDSLLASIMNEG